MTVVAVSELRRLLDSAEQGNKSAGHAIIKMFNGIWKENADIYDRLEISERKYKRHDEIVWKQADNIVELVDKNAELSGKIGELESQSVHIYNSGYRAGHNDTVEGCYTDIVSADMDTYHADVVQELNAELGIVIKENELFPKWKELEQYAELGRLAVEAMSKADGTVNSEPCIANVQTEVFKMLCGECYWLKFCQKRAESLVEV